MLAMATQGMAQVTCPNSKPHACTGCLPYTRQGSNSVGPVTITFTVRSQRAGLCCSENANGQPCENEEACYITADYMVTADHPQDTVCATSTVHHPDGSTSTVSLGCGGVNVALTSDECGKRTQVEYQLYLNKPDGTYEEYEDWFGFAYVGCSKCGELPPVDD